MIRVPVGRPRLTVFTVAERTRFLDDCLESLCAQTFEDWEWVLILPHDERWRPAREDPRVRLVVEETLLGAGALRRLACSVSLGELLVHLGDDVLSPDALEQIVRAFDSHPEIGFVYADHGQILDDGATGHGVPDPALGWTVTRTVVDSRAVRMTEAMAPTPHNISYSWYTPSHGRAWRRDTYERCGGYDATQDLLADESLTCKMFRHTDFHHIPHCLFLWRGGTEGDGRGTDDERRNHESLVLYDRNIESNALAWARRQGLLALDIGPHADRAPGYLGVGAQRDPYVGGVALGLDLPDSSVGVIRAIDVLPFIPDKIALFNEMYRLLAHGGLLLSFTPSAEGRGAFQDPRAVAYYNEDSFWYFTDTDYARFVPQITCRFQLSRLVTYFPTDWHGQHNIPYVTANLIAIKVGPRQGGLLKI